METEIADIHSLDVRTIDLLKRTLSCLSHVIGRKIASWKVQGLTD